MIHRSARGSALPAVRLGDLAVLRVSALLSHEPCYFSCCLLRPPSPAYWRALTDEVIQLPIPCRWTMRLMASVPHASAVKGASTSQR